MPLFSNGKLNVDLLSQESRNYLRDKGVNDGRTDWHTLPLERRQQIIKQLVILEKNDVKLKLRHQQRTTDKANYTILFLITAWALFGVGFSLAPIIAGAIPIAIPMVSVFLFIVAIIALTKIFLNAKVNHCKSEYHDAKNMLADLEREEADLKVTKVSNDCAITIQHTKDIQDISERLDKIINQTSTTTNVSSIAEDIEKIQKDFPANSNLISSGMFKPQVDREAETQERMSAPTFNTGS